MKEFNSSLGYFHITSVIKCCPEVNRYPSQEEIQSCRLWLLQEIMTFQPKSVIFFGDHCAKEFIKVEGSLINKIFETRFSKKTIVTHNPKSLRKNTDSFIEFKSAMRKFIGYCL